MSWYFIIYCKLTVRMLIWCRQLSVTVNFVASPVKCQFFMLWSILSGILAVPSGRLNSRRTELMFCPSVFRLLSLQGLTPLALRLMCLTHFHLRIETQANLGLGPASNLERLFFVCKCYAPWPLLLLKVCALVAPWAAMLRYRTP